MARRGPAKGNPKSKAAGRKGGRSRPSLKAKNRRHKLRARHAGRKAG